MSYVDSNLISGEEVMARASIHWAIFIPGAVFCLLGFMFMVVPPLGVILMLVGLWSLLSAFILYVTTEIAVTNKRVIGKVGLIRRDTIELNLNKVESLRVDQGIFGRIIGYGVVRVVGTGGSVFMARGIASPVQFKTHAYTQISAVAA